MNIQQHKSPFPSVFNDDFDNMFQGFFRPLTQNGTLAEGSRMPAIDIEESEDNFILMADLPGFNKDEINISFHDGMLEINAEHHEESEKKQKEGNVIKERHFGSFFRRINFGKNIDDKDIAAKYDKGVLELTIPKMADVEKEVKKIQIN